MLTCAHFDGSSSSTIGRNTCKTVAKSQTSTHAPPSSETNCKVHSASFHCTGTYAPATARLQHLCVRLRADRMSSFCVSHILLYNNKLQCDYYSVSFHQYIYIYIYIYIMSFLETRGRLCTFATLRLQYSGQF